MTPRERSWWGWGWTDAALPDAECVALASLLPGRPERPLDAPQVADLDLPPVRLRPPATLESLVSADAADRAGHTYGKAFRDVARALAGDVTGAPDLVARPEAEADVVALLDWAADARCAVVPYGAGSSVVGGTEYRGEGPWISLDLGRLDRVLELDATSRAARIQGGILGPALEGTLRPEGLTLRHFPQSFEFSTLGGWLATRSGGHYATGPTHIDEFVESMRVVSPVGVGESLRLPGSGAGPSPDRLFLGSEGILGVITEAWMRLQDRPIHRASRSVAFADLGQALDAVRAVVQAGLQPANCRLLDTGEAALSGASTDGSNVLVLGFESAHVPVDARLEEALRLVRDHGGLPAPARDGGGGDEAAGSWRSAFLRMPYVRDGMARMGVVSETFETACTWDQLPGLIRAVRSELGSAIEKLTGAAGLVNCRLTHAYPDGAAPYFTVVAAARPGDGLAVWDDLKDAAMDLLTVHGATVTHHHAVGRDHRPGYDRQRPDTFALALTAAKAALDPAGVLNPGVLIG